MPDSCRYLFDPPFVPSILFRWGYQYISRKIDKTCKSVDWNWNKWSVSMDDFTLMTGTFGLNRVDSCVRTSPTRFWWFRILRIFMIRTIAAWIKSFRSSSMCLCVASCSIFSSVFSGMLMFIRYFLLEYSKFSIRIRELMKLTHRERVSEPLTFYMLNKVQWLMTQLSCFHRLSMLTVLP